MSILSARLTRRLASASLLLLAMATPALALTPAETAELSGPSRQATLEAAARQEGVVTWYTTLIVDQAARPLAAAFEKKYPFIKVSIYRATGDAMLQRMTAEARAGKTVASVVEATGIDYAAQQAGLLLPFHSAVADEYPASRKDPAEFWVSSRINYFGLSYNTDQVAKADLPKSWDDLGDAKWKGKFAWSKEFVGAPLFITALRKTLGEERAMALLTRMSTLGIAAINANQRVVVDRVMTGEYAMSLDAFLHHPVISAAQGAPVASLALDPVTTIYGSVLFPKGAPSPASGMLLLDFILSKEGQQILAKADYFPARADVPPSALLQQVVPAKLGLRENIITPEELATQNVRSQEILDQLFH